eukprot:scaffold7074_cov256-Pinguiococcus_pyrenoidosus.AAC.15
MIGNEASCSSPIALPRDLLLHPLDFLFRGEAAQGCRRRGQRHRCVKTRESCVWLWQERRNLHPTSLHRRESHGGLDASEAGPADGEAFSLPRRRQTPLGHPFTVEGPASWRSKL